MSKMKIPIFDKSFIPRDKGMSPFNSPRLLEWVNAYKYDYKQILKDRSVPLFFTHNCFHEILNVRIPNRKIAWLIEPKAITPGLYEENSLNYLSQKCDYVLTHEKILIDKYSNFLYAPFCANWIVFDKTLPEKTKLVSMVASSKNKTEGQKFRIETIKNVKGYDLFGRGFNPVQFKNEALEPYMFSIAIENSMSDYYFTEKVMDCFSTKTIPIYRGCDISKWFNSDGIIYFRTHKELHDIIHNKLSREFYESKKSAIQENFNKARDDYYSPEDYIVKNYPFLFQ